MSRQSLRVLDGTLSTMVPVRGKPHTVEVHQKSMSVWVAVGDYNGEWIEAEGSSDAGAVVHWRKAAKRVVKPGDFRL